jgi:hypothetical protein
MSKHYPIIERHGDSVVVVARSTVDAQNAASEAIGGDCTITNVERVRDGGIGGFFATELVRVTARPSQFRQADREIGAALSSAEDLVASLRARSPQFAERLLDELRHGASPADAVHVAASHDETATTPRHEAIVAEPTTPAPVERILERIDEQRAPRPRTHHVAPPVPQPSRSTPTRWSHQALRSIGVPDRIVDAALADSPSDSREWIVALMGAFGSICVAQPLGPVAMVGPSCANLARQLRLVSVGADELGDTLSSVAVPNITAKAAAGALNGRFVHLVVGGAWHHLSSLPVHIVSAATPADILEAVRVCTAWDATLGWCWDGDRYAPLDEFTLVSHVRTILHHSDAAPHSPHGSHSSHAHGEVLA